MTKNITLGLLYYIRKDKIAKNGEIPIYLRITVDGQRSNISTNRTISIERWNEAAHKAKGTNEESRALNAYLDNLKNKIYEHHGALLTNNKSISA